MSEAGCKLNLAHCQVCYDDENSGDDGHDTDCSTRESNQNTGNPRSDRRGKRQCMADYATQDGHNEEGPANDSDAASPAGHVFAMKYQVRNACGQQNKGHRSGNRHTKNTDSMGDNIYIVTPKYCSVHEIAERVDEGAQRGYTRNQRGSIMFCASAAFTRAHSRYHDNVKYVCRRVQTHTGAHNQGSYMEVH